MEESLIKKNDDAHLLASYFEYEKLLLSGNNIEIYESLQSFEQLLKKSLNSVLINKIFLQIGNLYGATTTQNRFLILEVQKI